MHALLRCPGPADRVSGGEGWSALHSARLSRDVRTQWQSDGTVFRADRFVPLMTVVLLTNPTGKAVDFLSPSFGQVRQ